MKVLDINERVAILFAKGKAALNNSSSGRLTLFALTATVGSMIIAPGIAHAWTAPASGAFMYDMYDIGVNKLLKGPVGFVGGVSIIAYSASQWNQGPWKALTGVLFGSAIAKADSITSSLGAMIN